MSDDLVKRLRTIELKWDYEAGVLCELAADALAALQQRNAELEGALRFYADPDKYTDCHGADVQVPDFYSELDFGETARAALKGEK